MVELGDHELPYVAVRFSPTHTLVADNASNATGSFATPTADPDMQQWNSGDTVIPAAIVSLPPCASVFTAASSIGPKGVVAIFYPTYTRNTATISFPTPILCRIVTD